MTVNIARFLDGCIREFLLAAKWNKEEKGDVKL
jgi:hypothetical protein